MSALDQHTVIFEKLSADPELAHAVLFERRHPEATPDFHGEIIRAWWDEARARVVKAFRGGAKSTLSEEAMTAQALFRRFKYAIILGASQTRANERLAAIKHELETNDHLLALFGNTFGPTWNEDEIILNNDVKIQALGAGAALRGLKHWDHRPDLLYVDDLEDDENVATDEAIDKLARWFFSALLPALDPKARVRISGTPLHPKALLERLAQRWPTQIYPIVFPPVDEPEQWERSNWPARFPLEKVREIRQDFVDHGMAQIFTQEYLCRSENIAAKPFKEEQFQTVPVPQWAPCYVIVDPARTTNVRTSARTGYAVFAWVGPRLFVRQAYGAFHKPDEIVEEIFKLDAAYAPIAIGVEKDGLEEFLMQPLRARMLQDGRALPIKPLNAPRDKTKVNFILGLQPFFNAREVFFCDTLSDLKAELLAFPTGRVDVVNALAYAIKIRGGKPVYNAFAPTHVGPESLLPTPSLPLYLVLNARASYTTAILAQFVSGGVRVYADWVREGTPAETLQIIIPEARLRGGEKIELFAPADQFDTYNSLGLPQAALRHKLAIKRGAAAKGIESALLPFLQRQTLHQPAFLVSRAARWTVNALAGGYAREIDKNGQLEQAPRDDHYRCLMEGLESFARLLTIQGETGQDADAINWQTGRDGRPYISARPNPHGAQSRPLKLG